MSTQETYKTKVKELLSSGKVKMVIGYKAGTTADRRRPHFMRTPEEVDQLVLDSACITNLSGYLLSEGLLSDGKEIAVFLKPDGIRSINILAAEAQLQSNQVVVLGFDINGSEISALQGERASDFQALTSSSNEARLHKQQHPESARLEQMTPAERFAYWEDAFSRCIKCYACRQACPMCYCRRCIVDNNQPQWVNTSSHTLGNFEWNIVRAFHLAGRCVECGNCGRACPVNIPLGLLNMKMTDEVLQSFNHYPGVSETQEPVLASFKKNDSETFIL